MALRGCTRKVSSFLQVQSRCLRKSIKTQPSFSGNAYNLHHLSFYRQNWIHILVVCCLGIKRIILLLALCVCSEQKSLNWWHNILALNEVSCIVLVPLIKWTTPSENEKTVRMLTFNLLCWIWHHQFKVCFLLGFLNRFTLILITCTLALAFIWLENLCSFTSYL